MRGVGRYCVALCECVERDWRAAGGRTGEGEGRKTRATLTEILLNLRRPLLALSFTSSDLLADVDSPADLLRPLLHSPNNLRKHKEETKSPIVEQNTST